MSEQFTEGAEVPEHMLTTYDNPFNPFTQFDAWYVYDLQLGYNTSSFLDRIVRTSSELSEADQALELERAMDEIVRENVSGMWRKVSRDSYPQA